MQYDTKDKVADWAECEKCKGEGCQDCSASNPGYVLVAR